MRGSSGLSYFFTLTLPMSPSPSHPNSQNGKGSAIMPPLICGKAGAMRQGRRERQGQRRLDKLMQVHLLVHEHGLSYSAACRRVGISWVSRFRWERRLRQGNGMDGLVSRPKGPQASPGIQLGLDPQIVRRVQRLAVLKGSTVAAWKTFTQEPTCPPALRSAILGREVPEALRSAIGIKRKVMTVRVAIFKAGNFSHRHELKSRRRAE